MFKKWSSIFITLLLASNLIAMQSSYKLNSRARLFKQTIGKSSSFLNSSKANSDLFRRAFSQNSNRENKWRYTKKSNFRSRFITTGFLAGLRVASFYRNNNEDFDDLNAIIRERYPSFAIKDINEKDDYDETVLLTLIVQKKDMETLQLLLRNKDLDVNAKNRLSSIALTIAAYLGNKDIVKLLLELGADINFRDSIGRTALINAARGGHKEIAEVLLNDGADMNIKNEHGETALKQASIECHKGIIKLLLQSPKIEIGDICETLMSLKYLKISEHDPRSKEKIVLKRKIIEILKTSTIQLSKKMPTLAYERLATHKSDSDYVRAESYFDLLGVAYNIETECKAKTQSCAHLQLMLAEKDINNIDNYPLFKFFGELNYYVMLFDMHNNERIFNEQDMSVFIHGHKKQIAFFEDLYTGLVRRILDQTIPQDYLYIRYLNKNELTPISIVRFIWERLKRQRLMLGTIMRERNSNQLFMNAFIAGGCFKGMNCSLEYFKESKNVFPPDISTKDIFEKLDIEDIYTEFSHEIEELQKLYNTLNPHGRMLQIVIPNSILDDVVYLSTFRGNRITFDHNDKEYAGVSELLNKLKRNPESFDKGLIDKLEFVLVLTKDIALNPKSGIKIIPYETMAYAHKESKEYKKYRDYLNRFNKLMDKIAKEAIARKINLTEREENFRDILLN